MREKKYQIIQCDFLKDYKISLTFADGKNGVVDLSKLVGKGIFAAWVDEAEFKKVQIDPVSKTICWDNKIDLDPIYLRDNLFVL